MCRLIMKKRMQWIDDGDDDDCMAITEELMRIGEERRGDENRRGEERH